MEIKPNNIYLGDCYELIKQIPDKSIDLVYTDIPYQFGTGGNCGAFGSKKKSYNNEIIVNDDKRKQKIMSEIDRMEKIMSSTEVGSDEYEKAHVQKNKLLTDISTFNIQSGIDFSILDELIRTLKFIYIYIWCSKAQIPYLIDYFVNQRKCNYDILVWCKTNSIPKTFNSYLPNIEYLLFFREKGCPKHLNDGYELKSKWYVSSANVGDKKNYEHPTIKPLELVKRHIKHSTNEGDIVLDPFMGSGTTCKACKDLNRQYIGFEINEKYYNIAKDRLNNINAKGEISLF